MEEPELDAFEKYVAGTLSAEEHAAFDRRLKDDPIFKEDFELFQKMDHFLDHQSVKTERKKQFESLGQEILSEQPNQKPPQEKKGPSRNIWIGVILLLGVFLIAFYLLRKPSNTNPDIHYANYAIHEPLDLTTMGTNTDAMKQLENFYNKKEYHQALNILEEVDMSNYSQRVTLAKAICYLELNDFENAKKILIPISKGNSMAKYDAIWYLALTELKAKNNEGVEKYLKLIPKGSSSYEKAHKLLENIKDAVY